MPRLDKRHSITGTTPRAGFCPLLRYALLLFLLTPAKSETLRFTVKWPSGLNLGEANLTNTLTATGQHHTLDLEASLPAYLIHDNYTSITSAQSCTIDFTREATHGAKKAQERISVSPEGKITRETLKGGSAELKANACPHDPLALLAAVRRNFNQPQQTVLYGQGYPVRFEAPTSESVTIDDKTTATDKVICILTLPKTGDYRLELYFLKDPSHTPALIRAPFALGTFSMELIR